MQCRPEFDLWVGKISQRRASQPTPVFLPGESQGQEPGGLPSMGSHRVGHDWSDLAAASGTILKLKLKSLSRVWFLVTPWTTAQQAPVHGILQARTLEWVAISFSNAWKWKVKSESEVAQSCPTLSDPMDCSLPGSSILGIFQARVLEWGAIAFSIAVINTL